MNNDKVVRSPINYMGGKSRSLKYFKHLLPKEGNTFYDLFAGSGTVLLNSNFGRVVYNDKNKPLSELFEYLSKVEDVDNFFELLKEEVEKTRVNTEEGFLELREQYNKEPDPLKLFLLMNHSFSYLIRFNKKGKFNASYGRGVCKLGKNMGNKLTDMVNSLKNKELLVENQDFREIIEIRDLSKDDFVYLDPPYEMTQANYNENRGYAGWSEKDVKDIYALVQKLHDNNIPYGFSNTLIVKGEDNERLKSFIQENEGVTVQYIGEVDLTGIGTKKKQGKDVEVYITNTTP